MATLSNAEKFTENFINGTHTIYGVELKPFCLLHLLWLESVGSPLYFTSKPVAVEDVELAALICSSSTSEEILSKLSPKKSYFTAYSRYFWHRRNRKQPLGDAVKAYLSYQEDFFSLPDFPEREDVAEKLPWMLTILAAVIKNTGWDKDKVLAMPIGQLVWLNLGFSFLESGETGILTDSDNEAITALKSLNGF